MALLSRMIPNAMAEREVHAAAEALVSERLRACGIGLARLSDGLFVATLPDGGSFSLKVLARAAPHRRGGGNNLGLHWLLNSDVEDYVALVDLSRSECWLMPAAEFRARAQPLPGSRFHLDWLVLRLSPRSRVPDEDAFEQHRLENVMEAGSWMLEVGSRGPTSSLKPPTSKEE